jgi:hypothetical protein
MPSNVSKICGFLAMFALASCGGETIKVGTPPPPASYMVCDELPAKPELAPLEAITLPDGRQVYLKRVTDERDAQIARYIVGMRGAWFSCHNQLAKVRDYYEAAE